MHMADRYTSVTALEIDRGSVVRGGRDAERMGLENIRFVKADARHLMYVSCDVATWARDVAHFLAEGFELERFEPFDFYPHTHHIEVLSLLART